MSQAKVTHNKELKKNRKQILRQKKRKQMLNVAGCVVVLALVLGWLGWSLYGKLSDYQAKQEANKKTVTSQVDLSALSNYGADLSNETEK
ncbi:MAG: hypothetical protein IIU28_05780 [Lachnospiraceae bacterium]|nr:hypothetical protein [Lachnospiraceae bacterium]